MGGSQSSRKLTISNNDPTNVIKVSDSVVQRFRGEPEAESNKTDQGSVGETIPVNSINPSHLPPPVSHHFSHPYKHEPTLTSLQIRQEKEAELRANDIHWQKRINQMEQTHDKINQLMEQEYNNAMTEVKSNFTEPSHIRKPVCIEGKKAVLRCYKKHAKEPMLCLQEVQAFADCVDKHRSEIITNRG